MGLFKKTKTKDERKYKVGTKEWFADWFKTLVESLIIVMFLRHFVVEAHAVPTGSMETTIMPGDFLLAEKISYRIGAPKIGHIVVFKYPLQPEVDYVKRCVATEGDIVEFREKVLYINGEKSPYQGRHIDPHVYPSSINPRDNFGPYKVGEDAIFCAGDNRDNSLDSRFWGDVPLDNVKGRPLIIYYSTEMIGDMAKKKNQSIIQNIFVLFKSLFYPQHMRFGRIAKLLI